MVFPAFVMLSGFINTSTHPRWSACLAAFYCIFYTVLAGHPLLSEERTRCTHVSFRVPPPLRASLQDITSFICRSKVPVAIVEVL